MDYKKPFKAGLFILRIFGLWFEESKYAVLYFIYSFVFQGIFTVAYMVPMWLELFITKDLNRLTQLMVLGLTEVGCFAKIVNLYVNRKVIQECWNAMNTDLFKPKSGVESEICQRKLNFFAKVNRRFLTLCFCSFFSSMFVPLLEAQKILPYYSWWFSVEWRDNDTIYNIFYIYQCLGMSMHTLVNTANDLIFPFFLHFVVVQLEMLYTRLDDPENSHERKDLIEAIKQHNSIIQYCRTIEKTFSIVMFIQFSLSGFIICVSVYQLTMISPLENTPQFIFICAYITSMTIQIFLPCYYGNEVTLLTEQLSDSIINWHWIGNSRIMKHEQQLYVRMSLTPTQLMCVKFYNLNLKAFTAVLNTSYSLYAVLKTTDSN